nr:hypothetical protein [Pedococcus sp. 5OH_020]
MTKLEQVLRGEPASEHVIHADRAVIQGGARARAVQDNHRCSASRKVVEEFVIYVHWRDEDALDAPFFQASEVGAFAGGVLVDAADEE